MITNLQESKMQHDSQGGQFDSQPTISELVDLVKSLELTVRKQQEEINRYKNEMDYKLSFVDKALNRSAESFGNKTTSRRKMLQAISLAGLTATVYTLGKETPAAQADGGSTNLYFNGTGANPDNLALGVTSIITDPTASNPGSVTPILKVTNNRNDNFRDGISVITNNGVALSGRSSNVSASGTVGVTGDTADPELAALLQSGNTIGGATGASSNGAHGVAGISSGLQGAGVFGLSRIGPGVWGKGTNISRGGYFESATSVPQLAIKPGGSTLPGTANLGEVFVDNVGRWHIYDATTGAASWKTFGTSTPTGTVRLFTKPSRFIDTRPSPFNINDPLGAYPHNTSRTYTMIALTGTNGVNIPPTASGIVGNITVVSGSAGFLQISPAPLNFGTDPSSLNFAAGAGTGNFFICGLNGSGQVIVYVYPGSLLSLCSLKNLRF
jgi:hypothetical protein